ncbi:hypothetical protein ZIOFF_056023 [Zingiber officinale]|uniref:Uncharacterized protein n=1 Tax=Zingiber officinale TaxID=94328 RepID=A0A8J5FGL0_ZINOF|nr:hypothetical protein ZIOFF_056023 [Zingiber officinale]
MLISVCSEKCIHATIQCFDISNEDYHPCSEMIDLEKWNLSYEEEEEIVSAITLTLNTIVNKELKKSSLSRLLSSSYKAIEKLVYAAKEILYTVVDVLSQSQAINPF